MSRDPSLPGKEVIARLEYPLPINVAGPLMKAIALCAEANGYTDVVILGDGTGRIAGTPPPPGWEPPDELDDDADDDL